MTTRHFEFGPFRLDPAEKVLWRGGVEVRLTPKVFDLLMTLVRSRGHLLDKDALMRALWPGQVVAEANLTQGVAMLRKSLGDSASTPRYIETRARRGYRFIADVREPHVSTIDASVRSAVGRVRERAALRAEFDTVAAGHGRVVCVTGEPGMGKTTLVEHVLAELLHEGRAPRVAHGRCSQRLAGTGAYLPWLDALDHLLQNDAGGHIARAMRRNAPTWYGRVAAPFQDAGPVAADTGARATSQELIMRELVALVQAVSAREPRVIFLDDLQWADGPTVDMLAYLATRFTAIGVLIVVAYRPSELVLVRHQFVPVKQELQARGTCRELALPFLSPADIEQYLERVFPEHRFPAAAAATIHSRTEGNPLFMVDLVRHLHDLGAIARAPGGESWTFDETVAGATDELPASVRTLIERKIGQLDAVARRLLGAAGVQGTEFDSLVVARAVGMDLADVEEQLAELERTHAFVERLAGDPPGDVPAVRYRFTHVLYQDAIVRSLTPSRRATLSGAVAAALLQSRGAEQEVAPVLARLFEAARQRAPAAEWYGRAAERAVELFAHAEAAALARRGLQLLAGLPDSATRARLELSLQATLGVALSITSGYAARDTGFSLTRAYELCRTVGDTPQLFPAVWRLWVYHAAGAHARPALRLGHRLLAMARRSGDPGHLVAAHFAVGNTLHLLGRLVEGSRHLECGVARHEPNRCRLSTAVYGCDPGLYCRSHSARSLWLLGYPDRARRRSDEALALARASGDPRSLAHALMFAAICHQLRGEPSTVEEHGAACLAVCEAHDVADEARRVAILLGWARAVGGRREEGVAQIRASLAALRAMGSVNTLPYYLALLADALAHGGRPDEALDAVKEGLAEIRRTGERFYEAELHRLQGDLVLLGGGRDAGRRADAAFRRALRAARSQRARSLELRAATSLARAGVATTGGRVARDVLVRVSGWFTEGLDTSDARAARAFLERRMPRPVPTGSRGG